MGAGDRDTAMSTGDETVDRDLSHSLEIEIQPGPPDIREASAKGNEGDVAFGQILDARIVPLRGREDQAVGETARNDAAQVIALILLGRAEQGDEVELMLGEDRLHAVEDTHEEGVALASDLRAGLHHEANDVGGALPQAAARLVRHIAELLGRFEDPPARLLVNVGAAVQCTRNRSDRNIEMLR